MPFTKEKKISAIQEYIEGKKTTLEHILVKSRNPSVTKQDPMGPSQNTPPPNILCLPFLCRKLLIKEQKESKKWENTEKKETSQARQNNTSAINQSQGLLVPPEEL